MPGLETLHPLDDFSALLEWAPIGDCHKHWETVRVKTRDLSILQLYQEIYMDGETEIKQLYALACFIKQ